MGNSSFLLGKNLLGTVCNGHLMLDILHCFLGRREHQIEAIAAWQCCPLPREGSSMALDGISMLDTISAAGSLWTWRVCSAVAWGLV